MRKKDQIPQNDSYIDNLRRMYSDREMHKATCAKCGKECQVPFKPTKDRAVFCKECYIRKR